LLPRVMFVVLPLSCAGVAVPSALLDSYYVS
jgi:hypothetical protein